MNTGRIDECMNKRINKYILFFRNKPNYELNSTKQQQTYMQVNYVLIFVMNALKKKKS